MDWLSSLSNVFNPRRWTEEDEEDSGYRVPEELDKQERKLRTVSSHESKPILSVGSVQDIKPGRRVSTTAGNTQYTSVGSYTPTAPGQSDIELEEERRKKEEAQKLLADISTPKGITIGGVSGPKLRKDAENLIVGAVSATQELPIIPGEGGFTSPAALARHKLGIPDYEDDPNLSVTENFRNWATQPGVGEYVKRQVPENAGELGARFNPITAPASLAGAGYSALTGNEDPVKRALSGVSPYLQDLYKIEAQLVGDIVGDPVGSFATGKALTKPGFSAVSKLNESLQLANQGIQSKDAANAAVESWKAGDKPGAVSSAALSALSFGMANQTRKGIAEGRIREAGEVKAPLEFETARAGGLGDVPKFETPKAKESKAGDFFKDVKPELKESVFLDAKTELRAGKSVDEIASKYPESVRNEIYPGLQKLDEAIRTYDIFKSAADELYPKLEKAGAWTREYKDPKTGVTVKIWDRGEGKASSYYAVSPEGKLIGASGAVTGADNVKSISDIYKENFLEPDAPSSGPLYRAMAQDKVKSNLELGKTENLTASGAAAAERWKANEAVREIKNEGKVAGTDEVRAVPSGSRGNREISGLDPELRVSEPEGWKERTKRTVGKAAEDLLEKVDIIFGGGGGVGLSIEDVSKGKSVKRPSVEELRQVLAEKRAKEEGYSSFTPEYSKLLDELDESPELKSAIQKAKEPEAVSDPRIERVKAAVAEEMTPSRVYKVIDKDGNIVTVKAAGRGDAVTQVGSGKALTEKEFAKQEQKQKAVTPPTPKTYTVRKRGQSDFTVEATSRAEAQRLAGGGRVYTSEEITKQNELKSATKIPKETTTPEKIAESIQSGEPPKRTLVQEAVTFTRAVKGSLDFSAPLRQGLFYTADPKNWKLSTKEGVAGAMVDSFKAFAFEGKFKESQAELASRPNYDTAVKSGLFISDPDSITSKEEAYQSKWAEKVPGVARSERAFTSYMNKARMDLLDNITTNLPKDAEGKIQFKLDPDGRIDVTDPQYKAYKAAVSWVNDLTGRGNFEGITNNKYAQILLYSPGFQASRLNLLGEAPRTLAGRKSSRMLQMTPEMRKESIANTVRTLGVVSSVIGAAVAFGGYETSLNPEDPKFGKLVKGNTHIDLTAGLGPYIRLLSKTAGVSARYGLKKETPKDKRYNLVESYGDFARSKFSPVAGAVTDVLDKNRDFLGKKKTPADYATDLIAPMYPMDVYEGIQGEPDPYALSTGAAAGLFGAGVSTYSKKKKIPGPVGSPLPR